MTRTRREIGLRGSRLHDEPTPGVGGRSMIASSDAGVLSQTRPYIAVLDIGKSNAKLTVVDRDGDQEIFSARRVVGSAQRDGLRQLEVDALEIWLFETLRRLPGVERIGVIVPIAHGAACAILDQDDALVFVPDYEDPAFERSAAAYETERDPFSCTLSPSLPLGLNLGRQLFHLEATHPHQMARAARILLYPQYWAWRLSGVAASEITSLGCHTDLWSPSAKTFSPLARRRGWRDLFPPLRHAADVLGTVTSDVAARTGLAPECLVLCGLHDSNAAFLRYRLERAMPQSFCVVSSGTWTVLMAGGVATERLDPTIDMLGNVDPFGTVVATARFMGGREYAAIAGNDGDLPSTEALGRVLAARALALPSFAPAGPFNRQSGCLLRAEMLDAEARAALATLYLALVTDHALRTLGPLSKVVIEGPLAANPLFPGVLASLQSDRALLHRGHEQSGIVGGVLALLGCQTTSPARASVSVDPVGLPGLHEYREFWRDAILARAAASH